MACILVVDDDDMFRRLLCDFLVDAGHDVVGSGDPAAVTRLVGERAPDLAILDYMMPGMFGTDVLAELRSCEATRKLPVIFLSGTDIIRFSGKVPPEPLVRFMSKPLDFVRLEGAIADFLTGAV